MKLTSCLLESDGLRTLVLQSVLLYYIDSRWLPGGKDRLMSSSFPAMRLDEEKLPKNARTLRC